MARRRPPSPPNPADGRPILPRHLADRGYGKSAEENRQLAHEQAAWFRAHGIDPGNWSETYPVLLASWKAYGIESSAERARRRLQVGDPHPETPV